MRLKMSASLEVLIVEIGSISADATIILQEVQTMGNMDMASLRVGEV